MYLADFISKFQDLESQATNGEFPSTARLFILF